jgi:hypothetical protein
MKLLVQITPKEFYNLLSEPMKAIFDKLVKGLEEFGYSKEHSEVVIADMMLKYITVERFK